ncbi:radical SAM protein [Flavonifractor sp. An10]|uniref:radical SAM protein n=1 Tax=Flavonifractor sp. An10 TaxID=1965537 RepID=UPI000B39A322|nr:radical SAM protein [Flavonifractor sp. An10]OUQ83825.1 hypothetical protein B5E42_03950 [Flavonifractor sp. An10]
MIGVIISTFECNLSCRYCYEHSDTYRTRTSKIVVNNAFAENLDACEEYISCLSELARRNRRSVQFILHGGEPLLIAPDNLEKLFELIRKNGNPAIQIQTNGTLITQRTAELFHQYDVGIVVSLDGPKSLHDEYRKNAGGFGTYSMVMRAIDLLRNNRVDVSALATVTELSSSRAKDIFTFFSCLGMDFSVNRCFPVLGMQGGISEQTYQTFLSMLFDLYRPTDSEHCGIKIPCFDRCIHDLKWDGSSYCYNPHVSPYVSVFCIPGKTFGFAAHGKNKRFDSLLEFRRFSETAVDYSSTGTVIRMKGSLKDAVIRHLCQQQANDYLSALTLGV